ncbi:MAG TPA: hypothetical protein VFZ77_21335 [Acidimicrobiales bacterium]
MTTCDTPSAADRAARFLRSDAGRAAVRRALRIAHLPASLADDLVQDALRRVWVATSGDGAVVDNLEALVTTVLHRAAVDIVRNRVRGPQVIDWREGVDPDAGGQGTPFDGASSLDVEADVLGRHSLAAVRRAVHHALSVDPAAGAAALAYLAVAVDGAAPGPDCPQPAAGSTPGEAIEWAALWYAGRSSCFDAGGDGGPPPSAVRKRRSRQARRMRELLAAAASSAGVHREGALHG